jgi:hypothetical protein
LKESFFRLPFAGRGYYLREFVASFRNKVLLGNQLITSIFNSVHCRWQIFVAHYD